MLPLNGETVHGSFRVLGVAMRVDGVSLHGPGTNPGLLSEWRVGAILEAIAVRDAKSGQLWLEIAGQRHPARIASSDGGEPENGERLQLRVLRNSPVLALETLSAAKPADAKMDASALADALRRYVPRQESPAPMLANLAWIAQGKLGTQTLPKAVVQAAMQLWLALPDTDALSDPDALEAAIQRSGVFLEADLAAPSGTNGASFRSDLKALMLSLSQSLRAHGAKPSAASANAAVHATPPSARSPLTTLPATPATFALIDTPSQQLNELSRQTDGALARLTTAQISSSAADSTLHSVLIELPVRSDDRTVVLRLKIERDGSRRHSSGSDAWMVEAAVDLGAIGALHAKITLAAGRIGVQLRADSPGVVEALSRRAGELESMLKSAGLEIDRIVCLHGMPAGEPGARTVRLLDVRA